MVLVGFSKKFDKKQIVEHILSNGITECNEYSFGALNFYEFQNKPNYEDIYFFEVETQCIEKYGLCCFGERREYYEAKDSTIKTQLHKYEEDIDFWLSFVKKSCQAFDSVALYKYYPDINTPHTVSFVKPSEINADILLNMNNNHLIVIQDKKIISCKRDECLAVGFAKTVPVDTALRRLRELGFSALKDEIMFSNDLYFVEIELQYRDTLCRGIGSRELLKEYKSFEKFPIYEYGIKEKVLNIEQSAEGWKCVFESITNEFGKTALWKKHGDVKIPHTVIALKQHELTAEHFIDIENNQMLIINL